VKSAVFNTSPLIILARADYLDLIPKLITFAVVPQGVVTEVRAGATEDPAAQFLKQKSWLTPVEIVPPLSPLASWRLGQGETEVLEYARRNPGSVAPAFPHWHPG